MTKGTTMTSAPPHKGASRGLEAKGLHAASDAIADVGPDESFETYATAAVNAYLSSVGGVFVARELARAWLNVRVEEVSHPLMSKPGCAHCEAEYELRRDLSRALRRS